MLDKVIKENPQKIYKEPNSMHEGKLLKDTRFEVIYRFTQRGSQEEEEIIEEFCADKNTYNCTFKTNYFYPANKVDGYLAIFGYPNRLCFCLCCTLDFEPYEDGMETCCKRLKKCVQDGIMHDRFKCENEEISISPSSIMKYPRENPKSWAFYNKQTAFRTLKSCNM
uniref:Uncharacterized protein n=1 Tax=Meloidogyne incognita TaxID=6306 RepID=A0A914MBV6_MELIC